MITASQLREARVRAGYTSQAALAEALGVSLRTVTAWEQDGAHVSPRNEAKVRALLWPSPQPLSYYSNYELLSEIGRRLERMEKAHTQDIDTGGEEGPGRDRDLPRTPAREGPQSGWGPLE